MDHLDTVVVVDMQVIIILQGLGERRRPSL
jgi:hypothetical protein